MEPFAQIEVDALKTRDVLAVFNRGRVSRLALARTDVARIALSAEEQSNWVPRSLGSMMVRPGLEYVGALLGDGALIPFVFANDDTAIIELTAGAMRVWGDGSDLVTRQSVGAAISNGGFDTDLSGWTDADDAGAASTWATGGLMQLVGTGRTSARRRQAVSTTTPTLSHGLRVVVSRGPVYIRIGTTAGDDDILRQAVLRTGTHSLAFIPGGDFHIELSSPLKWPTLISSCSIEAAGVVSLPTPWDTVEKCKAVRWHQSADVVFCAVAGVRQQRIERRSGGSWSVVDFTADDGPFLTENVLGISITPSGLSGAITLTASQSLFREGHVGALFKLDSQGQLVQDTLAADGEFSNYIRVSGAFSSRDFTVKVSGTWSGTLSLQRSAGEPGTWLRWGKFTSNATREFDDDLDNSVMYYRIGFAPGDYVSGSADIEIDYPGGSISGVVRVSEVASSTSATALVLTDLGNTTSTEIWAEGSWSDVNGYPSAVCISEGRLWWAGNGRAFASMPDAFAVHNPDTEGDSQPINRMVGDGPGLSPNWMLSTQQLIIGTDSAENSVRSSTLDELVTPSNYNSKARTTKGSAQVPAVMADGNGFFVGRTKTQIFELSYDASSNGYSAVELTALVPEILDAEAVRLGIQQSPDTRLHAIKADGSVSILVREGTEDVLCWVDFETDGEVEDVVVLPGTKEDRVFYRVKRVINGSTVRYLERWAREDECRGGAQNKMADSYKVGTGSITGLSHLEGETVVIWGDGQDRGTAVVSSGAVSGSYTAWCVGLPYEALYRSAKLAGQTSLGLSLTQKTRINSIGLLLADTHAQGLQYGPDFDVMDDLPLIEDGAVVDAAAVWDEYDKGMVEFPGEWSTDNRVCLRGAAPRPCTVLAAVLNVDRRDS